MNCGHFQKNLYDYLDESLSPAEMAAAKIHLVECAACRAAVKREQQVAKSLGRAFEQNAETVTLDADAQRRMVAAVHRKIAVGVEPEAVSWWRGLIPAAIWNRNSFSRGKVRRPLSMNWTLTSPRPSPLPYEGSGEEDESIVQEVKAQNSFRRILTPAFSVGLLIIAVVLAVSFFYPEHKPDLKTPQMAESTASGAVLVNVSYCVPSYTFQRQGNLVIDALTCDERVVSGALLAKN